MNYYRLILSLSKKVADNRLRGDELKDEHALRSSEQESLLRELKNRARDSFDEAERKQRGYENVVTQVVYDALWKNKHLRDAYLDSADLIGFTRTNSEAIYRHFLQANELQDQKLFDRLDQVEVRWDSPHVETEKLFNRLTEGMAD